MNVRRVVTGKNAEGRSYIKWDNRIKYIEGRPGFKRADIWATDSLPPKITEDDPSLWDLGTSLSHGSVLRYGFYEPGVTGRWHATDSIDYAIVLSGEMVMQLDEGEVTLKPGDVVIQRETNHNWVNRSSEPCIMIYIIIATEGGESTGW